MITSEVGTNKFGADFWSAPSRPIRALSGNARAQHNVSGAPSGLLRAKYEIHSTDPMSQLREMV